MNIDVHVSDDRKWVTILKSQWDEFMKQLGNDLGDKIVVNDKFHEEPSSVVVVERK